MSSNLSRHTPSSTPLSRMEKAEKRLETRIQTEERHLIKMLGFADILGADVRIFEQVCEPLVDMVKIQMFGPETLPAKLPKDQLAQLRKEHFSLQNRWEMMHVICEWIFSDYRRIWVVCKENASKPSSSQHRKRLREARARYDVLRSRYVQLVRRVPGKIGLLARKAYVM